MAGNDSIDGAGGTDTVIYSGVRASYAVARTAMGHSVIDLTGAQGADSLTNVERLKFADGGIALDVGANQAAGQTQLLLGAVLGRDLLASKQPLIGVVIDLFDQGYTLPALSGALMRLDIWGVLASAGNPASNAQIASYLLTTVNGIAPDATAVAAGEQALNAETGETQGSFLWHLAESAANQTQVALAGLAATGLLFG
jgi:hypothetical protein